MNIALIGYGRMGRVIENIARQRGHDIALTIDAGQSERYARAEFRNADVAIEFTGPASAEMNCRQAMNAGVPVVCGSTGFMTPCLLAEFARMCKEEGRTFFYASNFSIGMNIFFALNRRLADLTADRPNYKAQLTEIHHLRKLDAPSGSAVTVAEDLILHNKGYTSWQIAEDNEAKLPAGTLPIHVRRLGEVPGIHELGYTSEVDRITIRHEAFNRNGFALGAVLAAEYCCSHSGLLTMNDLLSLDN